MDDAEKEAISRILMKIVRKWEGQREWRTGGATDELLETVILPPGDTRNDRNTPPPSSLWGENQDLVTETVLLSPKRDSPVSFRKVQPEGNGLMDTHISLPDPGPTEGEIGNDAAARRAGNDVLAETMILGKQRWPEDGKDGTKK